MMKAVCLLLIPALVAGVPHFNWERNDRFEDLLKQAIEKFQKDMSTKEYYQMYHGYHRHVIYADTDFEYDMKNIKLYHLDKAVVNKLEAHDGTMKFSVLFPEFNVTSHYTIDGKIMKVPIKGDGTFKMGWEKMIIGGSVVMKLSDTEMQIDEISLEYDFQDIYFHVDGLHFMDMTEEEYNAMLFGQAPEYLQKYKKQYAAKAAERIKEVVNKRLKNVPLREVIKKLEEYVKRPEFVEDIEGEFLAAVF